jgi:hypothetical protein
MSESCAASKSSAPVPTREERRRQWRQLCEACQRYDWIGPELARLAGRNIPGHRTEWLALAYKYGYQGDYDTDLIALFVIGRARAEERARGDLQQAPTAPHPGRQTPDPKPIAAALPRTRHSKDFRSVHWYGANYDFSEVQAAIIAVLWAACENGTPSVGHRTLLADAKAEYDRLPDVFKPKGEYHAAWGTMIQSNLGSRGEGRLCPADAAGS